MNPRKKIIISLITFGIVTLILIFLIISPLLNQIKENSEELILQKQELILLQEERKNLKEIETVYESYQLNLTKIDKLFIDSEIPIEFVSSLEELASTSQLLIKISPVVSKEVKEDPWSSLSFQLSLSGSFPDFLKFLKKLENSPYLIEVLNLNTEKLIETELWSENYKAFSPGDVNVEILVKVFTK